MNNHSILEENELNLLNKPNIKINEYRQNNIQYTDRKAVSKCIKPNCLDLLFYRIYCS